MEDRLSIREPQQGQDTEERRRGIDSPLVSQLGTCGLLPVCIYCLYAVYTEIHSRYFCLTPFVREYNTKKGGACLGGTKVKKGTVPVAQK